MRERIKDLILIRWHKLHTLFYRHTELRASVFFCFDSFLFVTYFPFNTFKNTMSFNHWLWTRPSHQHPKKSKTSLRAIGYFLKLWLPNFPKKTKNTLTWNDTLKNKTVKHWCHVFTSCTGFSLLCHKLLSNIISLWNRCCSWIINNNFSMILQAVL